MKITTNEGLGYTGSVTLSVKKGKTTLSSRTIHNAGCLNLFKFVAACLKGDFLSSMLPNKICLFSRSATENASDESTWLFDEAHAISPFIYKTSAAISTSTSNNTAETKYVFRIPYSQILGKQIYKIALYDSNPTHHSSSRYAYIGLTKTESDSISWEPIAVEASSKKYALEIEWTLKIQNA